jgi:hypothetical protein
MSKKRRKRPKDKISVEEQLLWERRLRRQLDIESGEYNTQKRFIWKTTKKDIEERRKNDKKKWGEDD